MYKYLLAHEKKMLELLDSGEEQDWDAVKAYHAAQIGFMQHERLVHLIVMLSVALFMLGAYVVSVVHTGIFTIALDIILTVLEFFYLIHYYRLENGVQRWYVIYNRISVKTAVLPAETPDSHS